MSDMGEMFKEMNKATKEHHEKMLAKADTSGWTKHTDWHFSRVFNDKLMNWWPSSGKAQYDGKMIYGHSKVNKLITKLIAGESK